MSTMVSKLRELPIFEQQSELLAGDEGLCNEVQYITVMDAPNFDVRSLDSKVFVLTTLSAHYESLDAINSIIEALCCQRVSAIGIKLGRFVNEIDQTTIDIADKYKIPLFSFTRKVLFREMISDVLSEIILEQRSTINELNDLNGLLVNAILRNDDMKGILMLLTARTSCYCCCLSNRGILLSEHASIKTKPTQEHIEQLMEKALDTIQGKHINYINIGNLYIFFCIAHGQSMGFLMVYVEETMTEKVLLFANQIVSFLAIKFLEEHLLLEAEQRKITSILDEILFVQHTDETVVSDRVKLLGLIPQKHHVVVSISYRDLERKEKPGVTQYNRLDFWKNQFKSEFEQSTVFMKGSDFIVFVSCSDKKQEDCTDIVERMYAGLQEKVQAQMDIGFGLFVDDLRKLNECYEQAKRAVSYGRAVLPDKHVYFYERFLEIGLVSHGAGSSDSKALIERIMRPIQEYDQQFNTDLWNTLEKCLLADSLETAAKNLFIHISTLRYRLQKIKIITKVNFFTAQGRFLLHLTYVLSKSDLG